MTRCQPPPTRMRPTIKVLERALAPRKASERGSARPRNWISEEVMMIENRRGRLVAAILVTLGVCTVGGHVSAQQTPNAAPIPDPPGGTGTFALNSAIKQVDKVANGNLRKLSGSGWVDTHLSFIPTTDGSPATKILLVGTRS